MTAYSKEIYQRIADCVAYDQEIDAHFYQKALMSPADNQHVAMLQRRAALGATFTRERLFNLIDNVSLNQE